MRWTRLTDEERAVAHVKYYATWRRFFAFRPVWDVESRTVYWLEYVWTRRYSRDKDGRSPWIFEYRGGKNAPEVKLPPPAETQPGFKRR